MTTTTAPYPDVPMPVGATSVDDWEAPRPFEMTYRFVTGVDQPVTDRFWVSARATQFADGSIDPGRIESPGVFINDTKLPNERVQALISALQEALAQVERWSALSDPDGKIQP